MHQHNKLLILLASWSSGITMSTDIAALSMPSLRHHGPWFPGAHPLLGVLLNFLSLALWVLLLRSHSLLISAYCAS